MKEGRERAVETSAGRAFYAEGMASANALGWQLTWFVQGTSKRPERLENREQEAVHAQWLLVLMMVVWWHQEAL